MLKRACAAKLEDYMVPQRIEIRDELPRSTAGKIDKLALSAEALERLAAATADAHPSTRHDAGDASDPACARRPIAASPASRSMFARQPIALTPEDLAGVDVAVLGAPFDLAVTYRPGTRFGPRAVRLAEHDGVDEEADMELGIDPYAELTVVDYGDADAPASDVLAAHASIQARVGEILAAGAIPAAIGGDHSITLPILRALAAHHGADGFSVIHFDTHADTGEVEFEGDLPNQGQPFSRAVAEGALLGGNITQIGLRGHWPFPADFDRMRGQGFRWHTMGEIDERGLRAVLDEAIAHARQRAPRTYLTVDVDLCGPRLRARYRHAGAGRAQLARAARRRAADRLRARPLRPRPGRGLAALRRRRRSRRWPASA